MAKLALNKATLNREGRKLKAFRQFVPALDLKRKQLLSERQASRQQLQLLQQQLEEISIAVADLLPMLTGSKIKPEQLLKVKQVELRYVNLVGLELPELATLVITPQQYSKLSTPHWLDPLLQLQQQALEAEIKIRICRQRLELLEVGLQKTTQRLNLFDKVMIPQAQANMRKIQIALSDAERAGVVRAKIAKNKRKRMSL